MRYLSADQDYNEEFSGMLQAVGEVVGYTTKSTLSGERPDLRQYVQNYEEEKDLSTYMPPDVKLSVSACDSGSTCIYEGREAAVLLIDFVPATAAGALRTDTYAEHQSVKIYKWGTSIGAIYPAQPPLSVLEYYEQGKDNKIEFQTYPKRFRGVRAHLEDF